MRLILVRHGQTQWNRQRRIQGWLDSELTEPAIEEMRQMKLPRLDNPVIFSSDLGRAHRSAQLLAERYSLQVFRDKRLRERSFGILEGKVIDEDAELKQYWQSYHQRYQNKMSNVPAVEPEEVFEQRIVDFLRCLASRHGSSDVILVSHGEWLRALDNVLSGLTSWCEGQGIPQNGRPEVIHWQPGSRYNKWEKSA